VALRCRRTRYLSGFFPLLVSELSATTFPEEVIRRCFDAGIKNFQTTYKTLVDEWILYDNQGREPRPIDWSER
jgi:hypothetical protein